MFRLDYISCVLTISAAILLGQKRWQGWLIAGINSVVVCDIAVSTSQIGFIPANLFCIALYAYNVVGWRKQVKARRKRDRLTHIANFPSATRAVDLKSKSARQLPNKRRTLVNQPGMAEPQWEISCCERDTPSFLSSHERSVPARLDLWDLLS